jgi:hypothetical protein
MMDLPSDRLPKIYFFCPVRMPGWATESIDQLVTWQGERKGRNIGFSHWVLQTFVYLKEYGFNCELVEPFPEEGIILAHRDTLPPWLKPKPKQLLVCLQADRLPHPYAQLSIIHNPYDIRVNTKTAVYIPPWPQIRLIPRSTNRNGIFKNIAYVGGEQNLAPELMEPSWNARLKSYGLDFEVVGENKKNRWRDYSQIDAIVAVRSYSETDYYDKPALKLFNSWQAGVPAILGVESAYRAERRSELDYIEVTSIDETLSALKLLLDNENLRKEIVNNGWERAEAIQPSQIVSQWINFLTEIAIPHYYQNDR